MWSAAPRDSRAQARHAATRCAYGSGSAAYMSSAAAGETETVLRQTARLMHEPHVPFQCQVAVWQQTKRAYTSPGQGRPPKRPNRPCAMITCEDSAHRFGPTAAGKQSRPGQSADCIQRSSLPTANRPRVQRTSQAQRERGGDGRHERRGVGRALQRGDQQRDGRLAHRLHLVRQQPQQGRHQRPAQHRLPRRGAVIRALLKPMQGIANLKDFLSTGAQNV